MRKGSLLRIVGVGVPVLVLLVLPSFLRIVPPGFAGVVTSFGRVEPVPLTSGLSFVAPWKKVVRQDIRVQVFDDRYECASADMQAFQVRFILNYRRVAEKTPDLFRNVGESESVLRTRIFAPAVRDSLKSVMGRYRISELSEKRPDVLESIRSELEKWIAPYHLELLEVSLADVQFSGTYRTAVEVKQVEEQRAEKAKYELTRTGVQAQINEVRAQGEADARAEVARGEAEAVKIRAKAEAEAVGLRAAAQAEANRAIADAYRRNLLLRDQVESWNGRPAPVAIGSESLLPFTVAIPDGTHWNDPPLAPTTPSDSVLPPAVSEVIGSDMTGDSAVASGVMESS
ncbi:MAG: SPFH domain-containing protein, partial [Planctomycetia bacterium]|nr:SPFH domain-containing protein [Planctomycetia bacterium]